MTEHQIKWLSKLPKFTFNIDVGFTFYCDGYTLGVTGSDLASCVTAAMLGDTYTVE